MSATLTIYLLLYAFRSHFFHFVSFLAAVPRGGPHIQGYKVDVSLGDELQINCTSLYSKPAANLQFFINNKVSNQYRQQGRNLKGIFPQRKQDFVKKKSDLCFGHYIVLTILHKKSFKKPDLLGLWKNPLTIPCLAGIHIPAPLF